MVDNCRLCLSEENLLPIFGDIEDINKYKNILSETTGLKIEPNDGLPQKICNKCKEDVQTASLLRNRSRLSEIELIKQRSQNHEDTTNADIIISEVEENAGAIEIYDPSIENEESSVEIPCDGLEQDGDTTWPPRVNNQIKCEFCGKRFISTAQLMRHCRTFHDRELQCRHCGYLALDNTELKIHIRRRHTFDSPCNASYHNRRTSLQMGRQRPVASNQSIHFSQLLMSTRQVLTQAYGIQNRPALQYNNN